VIRVLLADDNERVRARLRSMLAAGGIEVAGEAGRSTDIAPLLSRFAPDVLVFDPSHRGASGSEAIEHLREQSPGTEIVVLTMERSAAVAAATLASGALGFVVKDRADDELLAAIHSVASGDEFISEQVAAGVAALRAGNRA
jgi:two-component system response regulator NreC